ncbi:hypothetical protein ACQJBY_066326 [Aegilops geniculata]
MNAVDSSQFREAPDLFEIEGTNGMPRACIDKLPEIRITEEYNQNAVGHVSRCSVCLQLNVIYGLLTGRLVREKVDPAVQRVVWSQMNAVDSLQFREAPDLFEIEVTNGMPRACIDKLPEIRITEEYNQNAVGHVSRCSVCLQV